MMKCKNEGTPSCDADGQVVSSEDAVVEVTRSQTPTTIGTTLVAGLQNNADNIANQTGKTDRVNMAVASDRQRELEMLPAVHWLSLTGGEYSSMKIKTIFQFFYYSSFHCYFYFTNLHTGITNYNNFIANH